MYKGHDSAKVRAADGSALFGLDAELAAKQAAKFDPVAEAQARAWIESVTGAPIASESLQEGLKDGVVLCNLINKIRAGSCRAPKASKMPFVQMENINAFLEAAKSLGVPAFELFMTVDLFENKNWTQVILSIHALARIAQSIAGYSGPTMGPKMAEKQERNFSEAQLREAMATPSKQTMGSFGGANASGSQKISNFDPVKIKK